MDNYWFDAGNGLVHDTVHVLEHWHWSGLGNDRSVGDGSLRYDGYI